jgi:pilus assembly protein Flp/PilA
MVRFSERLATFANDETGSTALEYALISSMFVVAIITALGVMRDDMNATMTSIGTELETAAAATAN